VERRVATDDGVRLWCADDGGDGHPVVLSHGGPGLWDYLEPLAALLPDRVRTIRWDQRGCGRSDRVGPYTVDRSVADLDAIRASAGVERWVVAGHSWGASLALQAVLADPARAEALVYVDGVGIGRTWNAVYHAAADAALTPERLARRDELDQRTRTPAEEIELLALSWSADYADPERGLELAERFVASGFPVNREANRAISTETKSWSEADLAARCQALDLPVLLLHGKEDIRPAWAIDTLADALPNAEVHLIAGAGHLPWVEAPRETQAAIGAFLAAHGLAG
jgi:proline iminopeptidase